MDGTVQKMKCREKYMN